MAPRSIERVIDIIQDKSYCDNDGCYIWNGCLNQYGYGVINYWRRQWLVHRLIYIHVMFKPETEVVMHSCDKPACWCPEHLIGGTNIENLEDMVNKNRHSKGITHYRAALTEATVLEIRASTLTDRQMAKKLNIDQSAIRKIRLGITWKHL